MAWLAASPVLSTTHPGMTATLAIATPTDASTPAVTPPRSYRAAGGMPSLGARAEVLNPANGPRYQRLLLPGASAPVRLLHRLGLPELEDALLEEGVHDEAAEQLVAGEEGQHLG